MSAGPQRSTSSAYTRSPKTSRSRASVSASSDSDNAMSPAASPATSANVARGFVFSPASWAAETIRQRLVQPVRSIARSVTGSASTWRSSAPKMGFTLRSRAAFQNRTAP